ncbi:MAG TPA: methionine--tRNA ligase subunit beta, partial [Phnomibacter sp.]|nr:methionine--tRNA ligase subunit beta [Phnomibacter sp.]
IIFPAMLKAHGDYVLPDNVPANEFLNLENDKVSTSRNWAVWLHEYLNDFPGCEDVLRYYLTTIAPETKDSDFTWKGFQDANNSELVSIFGNYVNRTFVLMHKLCGGKVPPLHLEQMDDDDHNMFADIKRAKHTIEELLEQYKFREALFEVIDLSRKGNQYMQKKEPWIKAKLLTDDLAANKGGLANAEQLAARQSIDNCMHVCLQLCANLAIFINPFLPHTAKKMIRMMKVVEKMLDWENGGKEKLLSVGYTLRAPELLFRKIEESEITVQLEKLHQAKAGTASASPLPETTANTSPSFAPVKDEIVYDDFAKLDLRIGTITEAVKVPKADKLLQLTIDLGFETRTIVSGIAQHFEPADIVGKQVTVVANLAPRKMRGIESEGMILMAEDANGKLHFMKPEDHINPGATVS